VIGNIVISEIVAEYGSLELEGKKMELKKAF